MRLIVVCSECGSENWITVGELIRCSKCGAIPKLKWSIKDKAHRLRG